MNHAGTASPAEQQERLKAGAQALSARACQSLA